MNIANGYNRTRHRALIEDLYPQLSIGFGINAGYLFLLSSTVKQTSAQFNQSGISSSPTTMSQASLR